MRRLQVFAPAFVFLTLLSVAFGKDHPLKKLYVSVTGNDANPGTLESPFKTITKGASVLRPGDTLFVRNGTYGEALTVAVSGTVSAPITIAAYPNEKPIIDGQGKFPSQKGKPLVTLKGSYIHMDGFEVRNSDRPTSGGIVMDGDHNIISHMNVHHHFEAGVLARGDYSIVEDSSVWENAYQNCRASGCPPSPYGEGHWATGLSAARNPINGITDHAILRRNIVFDNWGEGLSAYEAKNIVMEDNTVYDNWATDVYVSDASGVLLQRNLIYRTSADAIGNGRPCIQLADERSDKPRSFGNTLINNMCLNGSIYAFSWTGVPGTGMVDDLIANNTVVNGSLRTGAATGTTAARNVNTRIVNNIFLDDGVTAKIPSVEGLTFSNNLWSKHPPEAAMDARSIVADPKIARVGTITPGKLTPEFFAITSKSPACSAGLDLGAVVSVDAVHHSRHTPPCIGAYEPAK
jgi:parallel beta-helix repeat protein